ncbi:hypothetical protein GH714_003637 [Hevea brasiliensis]|uniref:BRF2-like C-terminal domain-containing protein n=1 Tax=Hevea brasiliensis TaxID=3981 RepID=A0A6A6LV69_HEVBR|nr:hypothetical protein GH714_003637 [Hevea brasiliensis]
MPCNRCGHRSLIRDDVTGLLVCESCGAVQEFDNYEARTGGVSGPEGVFIRVGTSGTGSVLNYRDKKIFEANKLIDEITFKLDLVGQKVSEIKSMIDKITEEIGNVIGCDVHELGRMIMRVVDHLNIKLPEFDIVSSFEKVVRNLSNAGRIESNKVERMQEQGVFLIQCAIKWFLSTGRRPSPIVAAVLVLVAELNGVEGLKIEEVAREVHAAVSTCRLRYRELLEVLVKVAEALPWGKDVTMKNIVKNVPFVIRYMEMKSMAKCEDRAEYDDSRYFELKNGSGMNKMGDGDVGKLQLSHECLSMVYNKFLKEGGSGKYAIENGGVHRRKSNMGLELHPTEWWNGNQN